MAILLARLALLLKATLALAFDANGTLAYDIAEAGITENAPLSADRERRVFLDQLCPARAAHEFGILLRLLLRASLALALTIQTLGARRRIFQVSVGAVVSAVP